MNLLENTDEWQRVRLKLMELTIPKCMVLGNDLGMSIETVKKFRKGYEPNYNTGYLLERAMFPEVGDKYSLGKLSAAFRKAYQKDRALYGPRPASEWCGCLEETARNWLRTPAKQPRYFFGVRLRNFLIYHGFLD
jgi:hypothetical protein